MPPAFLEGLFQQARKRLLGTQDSPPQIGSARRNSMAHDENRNRRSGQGFLNGAAEECSRNSAPPPTSHHEEVIATTCFSLQLEARFSAEELSHFDVVPTREGAETFPIVPGDRFSKSSGRALQKVAPVLDDRGSDIRGWPHVSERQRTTALKDEAARDTKRFP